MHKTYNRTTQTMSVYKNVIQRLLIPLSIKTDKHSSTPQFQVTTTNSNLIRPPHDMNQERMSISFRFLSYLHETNSDIPLYTNRRLNDYDSAH